jgi:predicted enzyme related to lactoylglutathione lyase
MLAGTTHLMADDGSLSRFPNEGGTMSPDWARPVVHWEIEARDPGRQRAFYGALCNWEIGEGPIMMIPAGLGGPEPGPGGHIRGGDNPGVRLYVQVRDLAVSLTLAAELGGQVVLEPFDVPGGPTLASILDPEDNPLVLVQQ